MMDERHERQWLRSFLLTHAPAGALAEPMQLARILRRLLERIPSAEALEIAERVRKLEADLSDLERIEVWRSEGSEIGLVRHKVSGPDASAPGSVPVVQLFLDESGDAATGKGATDWLGLSGIAMTQSDVAAYVEAADILKRRFFGETNLTFHEPQMRHRQGRFSFEQDHAKQRAFSEAISQLADEAEFVAFGVGIRKAELVRLAEAEPEVRPFQIDIYGVAIHLMAERFVEYLAPRSKRPAQGTFVFEAQTRHEDARHQRSLIETLLGGSPGIAQPAFVRHIEPGAKFVPKQGSHPTELADMLARDIFEWLKSDCTAEPARWPIWQRKFFARDDLARGKFGLTVFPDADIRQQIKDDQARVLEMRSAAPGRERH